MNAGERMRIADDLHRMTYRLMERTLYLSCEAEIFGSGDHDAELRMLHRRIASVARDVQVQFPGVRTPDEVQLIEQKRSPGDVGASRSAATEG